MQEFPRGRNPVQEFGNSCTWSACWIWDRDVTCVGEKYPGLSRGRAGAVVAAVGRWIDREWTGGNPWVTGVARGTGALSDVLVHNLIYGA